MLSINNRYIVEPVKGCWLYTGSINSNGYGKMARRQIPAHRVAYEEFIGPIPNGLQVLHRCDVRRCVNPEHLFAGTHQDNMDDMWAKGRGQQRDNPNRCCRCKRIKAAHLMAAQGKYCKSCKRKQSAAWRAANPEKMKAARKKYRESQKGLPW